MNRSITLAALFLSLAAFSQRANDQYSLEAGYGLGFSGDPGLSGQHFEVGFRYMVDESWGIKFDFGSDTYRTDSTPELGTDYKRYSVQGVYNLGRAINISSVTGGTINLLAHGGIGYSSLKSVLKDDVDNIGHVIVGVTPQLYLIENLALRLDTSLIVDFTQHYKFDGTYRMLPDGNKDKNSFTDMVFNASLGLTYYFGKNKSSSDWR